MNPHELAGWARQEAEYHAAEARYRRGCAVGGSASESVVAAGHEQHAARFRELADIADRWANRTIGERAADRIGGGS